MPIVPITLPTGSRPGREGPDGAVRLINCQAESAGRAGEIPFPIYAVAGLKEFGDVGNGPCRGLFPLDATLYDVSERQVFPVDVTGTEDAALGGFPGDSTVYIDRNQKTTPQVGLVSEGIRKAIESGIMSDISDVDLPPPNSLVVIDGYAIFGQNNGRYYISSQNEMTAIAALDFATAESSPDGLNRVFRRGRELLLVGEETIEAWTNTGASFPFERLSVPPMEFGILAPASAAIVEENFTWLAHDGTVRMAGGYNAQRISNHAVERSINDEADKAAIEAFSYSLEGHTYYVLSGDNFTWVFDFTLAREIGAQDAWHERQSNALDRWRARQFARFAEKNICGDSVNGKLYEIDPDTHDEGGEHLTMTLRFPIEQYPNKIRVNALYVDIIPGQGLDSSDAHVSDPKIMLRLSRDGGITWGNEMTRDIGGIGERRAVAPFIQLGIFDRMGAVAEIKVSAAIVRGISGMSANVDLLGT